MSSPSSIPRWDLNPRPYISRLPKTVDQTFFINLSSVQDLGCIVWFVSSVNKIDKKSSIKCVFSWEALPRTARGRNFIWSNWFHVSKRNCNLERLVTLCCLWKLEDHKNGKIIYFLKKLQLWHRATYLVCLIVACARIDADRHDGLAVEHGQAFAGCRGQGDDRRVVGGQGQVAGQVELSDRRIIDQDSDSSIRLQVWFAGLKLLVSLRR